MVCVCLFDGNIALVRRYNAMGHNNQISGQDRHQHRQQPAPGAYQPPIHQYYDYILSNWKV